MIFSSSNCSRSLRLANKAHDQAEPALHACATSTTLFNEHAHKRPYFPSRPLAFRVNLLDPERAGEPSKQGTGADLTVTNRA